MKNFYLICSKCGSDDIFFKHIPDEDEDNILEEVFTSCRDCATLTCVEEHNARVCPRNLLNK